MTPLSQMQATKNLLTETQRIAYVGLCKLACVEMVNELRAVADADVKKKATKIKLGTKAGTGVVDDPATESSTVWGLKIMARLYHHMELERDGEHYFIIVFALWRDERKLTSFFLWDLRRVEQKMIESLSTHGVEPMDLVPSLMTTHTVPNPEYDPIEAERIRVEKEKEDLDRAADESEARECRQEEEEQVASSSKEEEAFGGGLGLVGKLERRRSSVEEADLAFGQDEADDLDPTAAPPPKYSQRNLPPEDDDGVDIGGFDDDPFANFDSRKTPTATPSIPPLVLSPSIDQHYSSSNHDLPPLPPSPLPPSSPNGFTSPSSTSNHFTDHAQTPSTPKGPGPIVGTTTHLDEPLEDVTPVLPGVSTSLSAADENITLDIRWTIL